MAGMNLETEYANLNKDLLKIITYEKGIDPSNFWKKLLRSLGQ